MASCRYKFSQKPAHRRKTQIFLTDKPGIPTGENLDLSTQVFVTDEAGQVELWSQSGETGTGWKYAGFFVGEKINANISIIGKELKTVINHENLILCLQALSHKLKVTNVKT